MCRFWRSLVSKPSQQLFGAAAGKHGAGSSRGECDLERAAPVTAPEQRLKATTLAALDPASNLWPSDRPMSQRPGCGRVHADPSPSIQTEEACGQTTSWPPTWVKQHRVAASGKTLFRRRVAVPDSSTSLSLSHHSSSPAGVICWGDGGTSRTGGWGPDEAARSPRVVLPVSGKLSRRRGSHLAYRRPRAQSSSPRQALASSVEQRHAECSRLRCVALLLAASWRAKQQTQPGGCRETSKIPVSDLRMAEPNRAASMTSHGFSHVCLHLTTSASSRAHLTSGRQ